MTDIEVITAYKKMVYAIAYNYVRNKYDADDVFSETFLHYFKKTRSFESEEHRKAYLIRMTINCAKDFLNDKNNGVSSLNDNTASDDEDIYEDNSDEIICLNEAIEKLLPEERNLIYLFYYQQLPSIEIAVLLNTTDDSVRSKLKRIREKLRVFLTH